MSPESPSAVWERAYVGLGSNVGERASHLVAALDALGATPGVREVEVSSLYETRHVGPDVQAPHLNAVARFETRLPAQALLARLLAIECESGRSRARGHGAPRTLDLDLILYDGAIIDEPGLIVPHPRFRQREFVLRPVAEIAPELRDPVSGRTIAELLAALVRAI